MDENIRRGLQLTELDILAEVDRICRKYRIKYFLACGTLIGAVRHEGFIPWDDDIDIVMPMRDYLRFCKIAADELKNDGYFLQNFCTENVNWVFGKVRKDGTTCIEAGWEKKEIHQGVWIDIFPIIGVKDTHRGIQKVQKHVDFFKRVLHLHQKSTEDKETIKRRLLKAIPDRLFKQAALLYYRMAFKSIDHHKNCFCLYPNTPIEASYESKWFTDAELKKYENDFYPVPIGWKEYLTSVYGDFMTPPPPEKRNSGEHVVGIVDLNKDYREYRKANSTESAL